MVRLALSQIRQRVSDRIDTARAHFVNRSVRKREGRDRGLPVCLHVLKLWAVVGGDPAKPWTLQFHPYFVRCQIERPGHTAHRSYSHVWEGDRVSEC